MNNNIFTTTRRGHTYYIDINKSIIGLCNPILSQIAHNSQSIDIEKKSFSFYKKKYKYLLQHGLFNSIRVKDTSFHLLTPDLIEDSIINSRQIVFEVTDACNLKCKYCGYGEYYEDYDQREDKKLKIEFAISFLNKLQEIWKSKPSRSLAKTYWDYPKFCVNCKLQGSGFKLESCFQI